MTPLKSILLKEKMKPHPEISKVSLKSYVTILNKFINKYGTYYSYDKSIFKNMTTPIVITCPIHGEFEQTPKYHLSSVYGCSKCAIEKKSYDTVKLTTEEVIIRLKKLHNNRYTYPKFTHSNAHTKFIAICPEHGEFKTNLDSHLYRKAGCYICNGGKSSNTEEFKQKMRLKYGDLYDLSKVVYINNNQDVIIGCPTHGDISVKPADALSKVNKLACNKCATGRGLTVEESFNLLSKTYPNYEFLSHSVIDTSKIIKDKNILVDVHCKKHNLIFKQRMDLLKRSDTLNCGCPECNSGGFKINLKATLYYLQIKHPLLPFSLYKIGITNRTIEERFGSDMQYITILKQKKFDTGKAALEKEQHVLKKYSQYRYTGMPILKDGNTELFIRDVFNVRKQEFIWKTGNTKQNMLKVFN